MKFKIFSLFIFSFLLLGLFSGIASALTPPTGGVDYWNLSSFTNLWGTHTLTNDGTTSSTQYPIFGISGNSSPSSSYFDTNTDSIYTNYIPPINKNITFIIRIKPTSYGSVADFILDSHKAVAGNSGYYCIINNADSKVTCAEHDGSGAGSAIFTITSNRTLPLNVWTMITFESKGNIGTDVAYLYFNKTRVGKASISTLAVEAATTVLFYGAYDSGSSSNYFNGYMDTIKIYNKSLSIQEIENEYNYGNITGIPSNATITAKSSYNGSSILSYSVRIQNGSTIRNQYTSTGTITTQINSTYATKYLYNVTFWNNSNHFNKTYLNYNFSAHSNTIQGNLTRSFLYANVRSNFDLASITFNATVNSLINYLSATKNTKIYLGNDNLNVISFSSADYKTQIVSNLNTSSNLTITLNRTYQYIFPRNKSSTLPIAYFNVSNGTHTYLNAQNTTKIFCYATCSFTVQVNNFLKSYFTKDSTTNKNLNMTYAINRLYFKNSTGTAISGATIQITYPSGYIINRTTNAAGLINFSSIPLSTNETGLYQFVIFNFAGYVTPRYFNETLTNSNIPFNKNYTLTNAAIIIKTYRVNGTKLLGVTSFSGQGTIYSFSGLTNSSGEITKKGTQEDIYEITFTRTGFNPVSYYVNFTNREQLYLNVYMINSTLGNEKTFYTKDSILLSPLPNTLITFTKQINGSYISIGQILTDGVGFGSIYLENNIKYRLQIEAEGYTTKVMYLSTIVGLSSYDMLLDPISSLNFTEFYDYFNYYISPSGNVNLNKGIKSFNLTTSSSGSFINWFAVKYGATVNNVSGSPAGGMATINLNLSALPEYFTVYYYINIDNYDTIIKPITYHISQSLFDISFIDSESDNPVTGNKNKGIFASLLIVLFILIASKMFDIDKADGSKTYNSIVLLISIILFMFIGFIDIIIGTVVCVLLVFTLIPRGDY